MANESHQRRADAVQILLEVRQHLVVDVAEAPRRVEAVRHFGERRFGDVQEAKTIPPVPTREAFSDVRRHRIRSLSNLCGELEALNLWKRARRERVNADEEIVRALPG